MDTRARILAGARSLLFSRGYRSFTLESLATEIGIARKTIYNHFPGRETLVEAAFLYDAELWVAEVQRIVESRLQSFTDKASLLMKLTADRLRERGEVFAQAAGVRRQLLRDQNAETFRDVVIGPLTRLLSEGVTSGHIRKDIDLELVSRGLLNVILGHDSRAGDRSDALAAILSEMLYAMSVGVLTPKGRRELTVSRIDSQRDK